MEKKKGAVVAYTRVSSRRQGVSGLSLAAQISTIETYAAQHGMTVVSVYTEVETGTNRKRRPVLAEALDHAKRINAVLAVAKLDRLSRSVSFVTSVLDSGVNFVACDMPQADRMMLQLLAVVAEYEAGAIATRISAVTAQRRIRARDEGKVLGKQENFSSAGRALGNQTNRLNAVANRRMACAHAKDMRERGMSYRAIAGALTDAGHGTYAAMTVKRMLERGCD